MNNSINKNISVWLSNDYDQKTHEEIHRLIAENPQELEDAFYKSLEFGTGGMRGIMGVGTNRMNKYTVAAATQGFALYLKKSFPKIKISVAIGYDSRHNSKEFARITADVFSANKIHCYLFENICPTPLLSFAVRHLQCQAGVMITASHNPKEYNGYKAYWADGGQLVSPHDVNVIGYVNNIKSAKKIKWDSNAKYIHKISSTIEDAYLTHLKGITLNPDSIKAHKKFKIVYTPLHGTGITIIPKALATLGFRHVILVDEQSTPDGDFPTVKSPNPEERAALELAIKKAIEVNADLVLATDPDADRVAVAVKNDKKEYILLNGNQIASLLFYYVLSNMQKRKTPLEYCFTVKTIVTSELLHKIAIDYNVPCYNVLTGFKYIAAKIAELEGKEKFLVGGEESFGYLIGDFVRDKDAISSCCMIAEMAINAINHHSTLYHELLFLYKYYFFPKESLVSIKKEGKEGLNEIANMMYRFRYYPPEEFNGTKIIIIHDYLQQVSKNCLTKSTKHINLPTSNVIQYILEDGSIITVRPSGTEPKIKFYFSVRTNLKKYNEYEATSNQLDQKLKAIIDDLELQCRTTL